MTPRYRYLSSAGVGILRTRMIGDVLERAPRPYTAQEISELTGISTTVVVGFLTRNYNAGRLSMREDTVHHPRHGWPAASTGGAPTIWKTHSRLTK